MRPFLSVTRGYHVLKGDFSKGLRKAGSMVLAVYYLGKHFLVTGEVILLLAALV